MNVFVMGGAGYIGSVCVEELLNVGHQVTVFDNLTEGHRSAVDKWAMFVQGDLSQEQELRAALQVARVEAVIHYVVSALVGESMIKSGKYFRNNVANGLNLLEASVATGVRKFVFSFTCATYGLSEWVPMMEDLPQWPINSYGEAKLMFEKMLGWYEQVYGLEFVAFRYFNVVGASAQFGEHHRIETHLIPNVLKVFLGQVVQCEIYGMDYFIPDGICIRDYIHVIDLVAVHMLALLLGRWGFFNLGNGDGYFVCEVISMCEKVIGRTILIIEKPWRFGDPSRLVAVAEKAHRELGWKPKFPKLEEIVSTAWLWHKKYLNGYRD